MDMFTYEGNKLAIIKKDDDIWFRAKTIAIILGYSKIQRKAIFNDHVDSEDKCSLNEAQIQGGRFTPPLTWEHSETLFI